MTPLETQRLTIRNWEERDRDLFYRINSDEQVMAFFPFRRDREEADHFFDRLGTGISESGVGFTALELRKTRQCIGFTGLHADDVVPTLPAGTIEIGWRLAPEFWGFGYVTEAAEALLRHGFEQMRLDRIVSYAVWNNTRSTAVMQRIGMTPQPEHDFDHPRVPETHSHLRRHVFYRMTRAEWLERQPAPDLPAP